MLQIKKLKFCKCTYTPCTLTRIFYIFPVFPYSKQNFWKLVKFADEILIIIRHNKSFTCNNNQILRTDCKCISEGGYNLQYSNRELDMKNNSFDLNMSGKFLHELKPYNSNGKFPFLNQIQSYLTVSNR